MSRSTTLQSRRFWFQAGFFLLFILAPPLDLFRYDLTRGHFFFLGMHWTLGLDAFIAGEIAPTEAALNLIFRGFLPLAIVGGGLIWVAWRFGRLYCGWLCPHFSVVEMINRLMLRASGKPSIWEKKPLPRLQPDGSHLTPNRWYWPVTWFAALFFAFLWAFALLSYLLPPLELYQNLLRGELTPNQLRFLLVATGLLFIEFTFARHLFCRFGCAVGLFQSLAWMGNDRALVVSFDKDRARECSNCNNACENICPMRLKPRAIKRRMFTCTECAQCITACEQVQSFQSDTTLLKWVQNEAAVATTGKKSEKWTTDSNATPTNQQHPGA